MMDDELRRLLKEIKDEASYKGNLLIYLALTAIMLDLLLRSKP